MRKIPAGPTALLIAFLLGGCLVPRVAPHLTGTAIASNPSNPPPPAIDVSRLSSDEIYARAAAQAAPSVVYIDTESQVRVRNPFEEDFFGGGPRYRRVASSGSGVIVSADGDIMTNDHVVGTADRIRVTLADGRQFTGKVVGSDHSTDVALIHVDASGLTPVQLGTSQGLIPGQLAVALGNPLGLRFTVTHGIVSATGRPVKIGDRVYENLIQTDCAINPGNSGGALVDRQGRLIGINTLVMDSANGVGFAIPIDIALRITHELKKYGKVKRPWTGLFAVAVNEGIRRYFGMERAEGAFVEGVTQGSPAELAGVQRGDIITSLAGKPVGNDDDLRHITESLKIGAKAKIIIFRGGQSAQGDITLGESP